MTFSEDVGRSPNFRKGVKTGKKMKKHFAVVNWISGNEKLKDEAIKNTFFS